MSKLTIIESLKVEGRTKDEILTDLVILEGLTVSKANTYYNMFLKDSRPEVSFATTFDNYILSNNVVDADIKTFIETNAEPASVANKLKSLGYFKSRNNLVKDARITVHAGYKARALTNVLFASSLNIKTLPLVNGEAFTEETEGLTEVEAKV